jgi:predicted helicase
VVYTPGEIVRFMIESADWLCEHHFKRNLIDRDVEILDPAVGTGTFITELIEHFRGQPAKLKHKYAEELHANEVGILPYYVANLNIEATYAAIMEEYVEFPGLCLVDTLDNVAGLGSKTGDHVADLFGMGDENVERIKRQNKRKISVIIGNPPNNANQLNENDNNKNRVYPEIDKRIKDSYIKASTAQKTKLYDMYSRFFRWASDRMHDDGVLAFITNRSFLDARTFDGFRKSVAQEFAEIRVVDLGGDVRANPKLSGTTHNVFGIQTGVAISFLVKKRGSKGARIFYARRPEMATAEEKLSFLSGARLSELAMEEVAPDKNGNWLNLTSNDFDSLIPLASKGTKQGKRGDKAIFQLYGQGVFTGRDEWAYGESDEQLLAKASFFNDEYNHWRKAGGFGGTAIKWSRNLKRRLERGFVEADLTSKIVEANYRPFSRKRLIDSHLLIDERGQSDAMFGSTKKLPNKSICLTYPGSQKPFMAIAVHGRFDYHLVGAAAITTGLPLSRFNERGAVQDNITDWALKQFKDHYKPEKAKSLTKQAIFHYVYAVLHDPIYREKYAQNLKREFPRIPLYGSTPVDFHCWAQWGEALMALHIGYETIEPWPLQRTDIEDSKARSAGQSPKPMLKADKPGGRIVLDSETTLSGIPPEAWDYKLGNRSALEWILDQYKESKPRDPTIREKFDTYRFADHKDKVIDLLMRVTRVSVETRGIVMTMQAGPR